MASGRPLCRKLYGSAQVNLNATSWGAYQCVWLQSKATSFVDTVFAAVWITLPPDRYPKSSERRHLQQPRLWLPSSNGRSMRPCVERGKPDAHGGQPHPMRAPIPSRSPPSFALLQQGLAGDGWDHILLHDFFPGTGSVTSPVKKSINAINTIPIRPMLIPVFPVRTCGRSPYSVS